MFRLSVAMLSTTGTTLGLAVLGLATLGLVSCPVSAETAYAVHRHKIAHARLHRRASPPIIAAAPYGVPLDEVGPNRYPYNGGEDELGPTDGVRAGQVPTPGPRDYPGVPVASTSPRGFEIEGPPIYPSLPILPAYVDPAIYR